MRFPDYYEPEKVGTLYLPRTADATMKGIAARHRAAETDSRRTLLLLVDAQVDFVHADGALSVPGAVDDTRRTIEWLYRNMEQVTTVAASLDSHIPRQIFYATWWADTNGHHPEPFTAITADDVSTGRWQPLFDKEWSASYAQRLETQAKKTLMIWPYHTMIGTPGHAITPALFEAMLYHAAARSTQPIYLQKGSLPQTEHYSIFEPEVKVPGSESGVLNEAFLQMLAGYDAVYVAGQAKSHCVLETVASYMRYFADQPAIRQKLHILIDCTSSVAHPEIDFDTLANNALASYEEQGARLVTSTDPVG